MLVFKNVLKISLAGLLLTATISAMHKHILEDKILYTLPAFNHTIQRYTIDALLDGRSVGYISYEIDHTSKVGTIILLEVEKDFRNNYIGINLCKQAIQEMAYTCTHIEWEALPVDDVSLDELKIVYTKMAQKFGIQSELRMSKPYGWPNQKIAMSLKIGSF